MMVADSYTSVSRRFSFAFIGVVTLVLLVFAVMAIILDSAKVNADLEKQLDNALKLSSVSLPTPLWNLDNAVVDDFVGALFLQEAIVYAEVVWGNQLIARKIDDRFSRKGVDQFSDSTQFIDKSTDILFEGNKVGTIRLVMSRESVRHEFFLNLIRVISLTAFIILAISITSLLITRKYIAGPLSRLQESASSIAHGNLDTPIDKASNDEIGQLAMHLDEMRESIKNLFSEVNESKKKIEEYSRNLEQKVDDRTQELAQSVEELRALSEVSQVVGSSLDLDKVLVSIVRHAVMFSEADCGIMFRYDEEKDVFVLRTDYGASREFIEALRHARLQKGDQSAMGQAALTGGIVRLPICARFPIIL